MANLESPLDRLWKEYGAVFRDFDDLTLARWMAQTLGQLQGRAWRLSHPLVGAYRLAAQMGHERQIWHKRMATAPPAYPSADCCRAPILPLFTRDIVDAGLLCQHCGETCVPFDELPAEFQNDASAWAARYGPLHALAHWDAEEQAKCPDYDKQFDSTADEIELLLIEAGRDIVPRLLESFPTAVWEDQDECLEVRPEDIEL